MNDRFLFRAFYEGRFIYKNLIDANYYTYDNKCIGLANTLPNSLKWEQCTGLPDKNGKLIYEGDIVRWSLCRGDGDICENYQIIWRDNCAAFGCLKSNGDILDMFSQPELKAKVIGNVHENPDLLESEE